MGSLSDAARWIEQAAYDLEVAQSLSTKYFGA